MSERGTNKRASPSSPIDAVSHRAMGWWRQGLRVASFLDIIIVGIIAYLLYDMPIEGLPAANNGITQRLLVVLAVAFALVWPLQRAHTATIRWSESFQSYTELVELVLAEYQRAEHRVEEGQLTATGQSERGRQSILERLEDAHGAHNDTLAVVADRVDPYWAEDMRSASLLLLVAVQHYASEEEIRLDAAAGTSLPATNTDAVQRLDDAWATLRTSALHTPNVAPVRIAGTVGTIQAVLAGGIPEQPGQADAR
jgi:hypothetical protein